MNEYTDRNVTCEGSDSNNKPPIPKDKIDLTIGVFFDGTLNKYSSVSNLQIAYFKTNTKAVKNKLT